ncbi:Fanconi anemia group D2 protein, partial [Podila epicladia]
MAMASAPGSFYAICQQAGLTLGINGDSIVLNVEPTRFQREVARLIRHSPLGADCTESFLEGLQEHLEDAQSLKTCLMPIAGSSHQGSSFSLPESLIRILLSIDIIQPGLMEALLDRILGYLNEGDGDSPTPKIILQQLKWLNNVNQPAQLTAKLLEVISISPVSIQRDIIVALPEIVPDSEHKTIVDGLVELMESSSELLVAILDALSNLNLHADILINARDNVMDKLESAELDDLPIVIKFLLQTVEPDTVGEVIETLRQNLDFKSISRLQRSSKSKKKMVSQTPEVLILDALKTGIRFQKFVTDAWYKALVAIPKPSDHRVIDVMVLFILHSIVSLKKKVEVLIRKKIIEGMLTKKLLEDTISVHGMSLREYMPSILSISENLLRSSANHPIVVRAASSLYTSAFQVSDAYYRQEIVGSLLVHIGSGSSTEIDASLAVLQNIVEVSRAALNEFNGFIKGLLDYLDNMSLEQVRLFFIVLGSLAREDEEAGTSGTLLNELNITIRKQLSNPTENYKKVGVMGAIAMVQAFGAKETANSRGAGSSSQALASSRNQAESDPLLKISILYLTMIKSSCHKSAMCLSLTYDELANMVMSNILEPMLVLWIKEEFSDQFAGTFVSEDTEQFSLRSDRNIGIERWLNLDGPDAMLSISIMPKLCEQSSNTTSDSPLLDTPDAVICLCSLFKLMQATEKAIGENGLDDIDGVLGCSISMFKRDYLQHILELEDMMRHVLKSAHGFKPLEASNIKAKDAPTRSLASSSFTGGIAIQSNHGKGKGSTRGMHDDLSSLSKPLIITSSEAVAYESLAPSLRELEMGVFHALRVHEPIMREAYAGALEGERVQLCYPELRYLLTDLLAKVTFKLPGPPVLNPFGKKVPTLVVNNSLLIRTSTIEFVKEILKIVPHIVVKTRMMLALLYNDEVTTDVNGEGVNLATVQECLSISLKILLTLLSWNELKGSDQKEMRLHLLKALAIDGKSGQEVQEIEASINLSAVAVESFKSLATWRQMMPNFESSATLLEILDKILGLVPRNPDTSHDASEFATRVLSERWPGTNTIK